MDIKELTPEQRTQVKQMMLTNCANDEHRDVSMAELADADELVSDEELDEEYAGVYFSEDDFC